MIYLIAKSNGKGFIKQPLQFGISGHAGDVWVLEDNIHSQSWAQEKLLFNEGQIADKATAQNVINAATDDVDWRGNPVWKDQL